MFKKIKGLHYKKKITQFILKDDIQGLKHYLKRKKIVSLIRKDGKEGGGTGINKKSLLVYSIKQNASTKMIQSILNVSHFETLNFGDHAYNSPLYYAVLKGNFKLADLLIKEGADINYKQCDIEEKEQKKFFKYLYYEKKTWGCFKKSLTYMLSQGFTMNPMNLQLLITNKKAYSNRTLEAILQYYYRYDKHCIIDLLLIQRTGRALTNEQLKDILSSYEKTKLEISDAMYEMAIYRKNYEALCNLYKYGTLSKNFNIGYIFGILESFDLRNKTQRKREFIQWIERHTLNLSLTAQELKTLEHTEKIRADLQSIILSEDLDQLQSYIMNNKISIASLNHREYDILIHTIENKGTAIEIINYLMSFYPTLNYYIVKDGIVYGTPLSVAISQKKFTIADKLLSQGADLNYSILNLSYFDEYENVFDFLYRRHHHLLLHSIETIRYIFNHRIHMTSKIMTHLIYENDVRVLRLLFKYYPYNNTFVMALLSLYRDRKSISNQRLCRKIETEKNKIKINQSMYEKAIINSFYDLFIILLKNDQRGSSLILNELFEILNGRGYEYEKQLFRNYIRNNLMVIPMNNIVKKVLLSNMSNIVEKREEILKKIMKNDIKELKNYIEENNLLLASMNNYENDILIDSIEYNASFEMIEFILKYYRNLNYIKVDKRYYKTPLLIALAKNNFKVAKLLLEHGAYLNYEIDNTKNTIFYHLCQYQWINRKNLVFSIHHGAEITFYAINLLMQHNCTDLLQLIYRHYVFNNHFIIKILTISKIGILLSNKVWEDIIHKEKNKLLINEMIFQEKKND